MGISSLDMITLQVNMINLEFFPHCEKFLLENLKVGIDVAIFLFQLVVQIQTLVFLNQVPTHLLDKHIGIIQ